MSTHPHGSENVGSESSDPTARRRRRRALLAGGFVVGLGAVATMAAYSDNEFASGKFSAGKFGIQGSEGTSYNWADHATSDAAAPLSFSTGIATLQPGSSVYSPFSLRVDPNRNSYDAKIQMSADATTPDDGSQALASRLTYSIATMSNPTDCNAGRWNSGTPVVSNSSFGGPRNYNSFTLTKNSTPTTACIQVTMADDNSSTPPDYGTSPVTATWKFAGAPA